MANRTVNINQLTPKSTIYIRGRVGYCRIASKIEGDELDKADKRAKERGTIPVGKPHTKLEITNAEILRIDANNPEPLLETYIKEHMYTKKSGDGSEGWCYTGMNKGRNLPAIFQVEGNNARELKGPEIQGELDKGLSVTLVLRVFGGQTNNGISLDSVLVNEPIRFYSGSSASALAALGLNILPASQPSNEMTEAAGTVQNGQEQYGRPVDTGYNATAGQADRQPLPFQNEQQPQTGGQPQYGNTYGQPQTDDSYQNQMQQPQYTQGQQSPNYGTQPPLNMGSADGGIRTNTGAANGGRSY